VRKKTRGGGFGGLMREKGDKEWPRGEGGVGGSGIRLSPRPPFPIDARNPGTIKVEPGGHHFKAQRIVKARGLLLLRHNRQSL
jgi:hypothetical protein